MKNVETQAFHRNQLNLMTCQDIHQMIPGNSYLSQYNTYMKRDVRNNRLPVFPHFPLLCVLLHMESVGSLPRRCAPVGVGIPPGCLIADADPEK